MGIPAIQILLFFLQKTSSKHSMNSSCVDASTMSKIHLKSGIDYHQKGQLEEAKNQYFRAIKFNPHFPQAYYNLGILYYKNLNQYKKSIQFLKKALELDPQYVEAYVNLGNVYKIIKRYEQAQNFYNNAINCDQNNTIALGNLAKLYRNLKRFEEAEKIFYKLVELEPTSHSNHNNLAVALKNNKKYDSADCHFMRATELNPEYVQAYYNTGIMYTSINKFDEAENYLKKAATLKSDKPDDLLTLLILIARADNLRRMNKIDQAFQVISKINDLVQGKDWGAFQKDRSTRRVNLKWIKGSLKQLNNLKELNNQKKRMSNELKKALQQINNQFIQNFVNAENEMGENQEISKLWEAINQLRVQVNNQENSINQIKADVSPLKKQIEWDLAFDKLLEDQPQYASHYRNLYSLICTSIQSYRAVKTGIVSGGGGILKSSFGGIIQTVNKVLGVIKLLPGAQIFCQALSSIAGIYLGKQADYVCTQIVASTSQLYNDKKLTKAISQTILFLSNQPEYIELLHDQNQEKVWYQKIVGQIKRFKKMISEKQQILLNKMTQFGGHDIAEELNKVMGHSSQIIMNLIKNQNLTHVKQAQNPLLAAAQLWVKDLRTIRIKIVGAVLSEKLNLFCKISYGQQTEETEACKSNDFTENWTECEFTFQKNKNEEPIVFQIYKKGYFANNLVSKGSIRDNLQKQNIHSVQLSSLQKVVGYLEIELS